jgi:hypothetical protein
MLRTRCTPAAALGNSAALRHAPRNRCRPALRQRSLLRHRWGWLCASADAKHDNPPCPPSTTHQLKTAGNHRFVRPAIRTHSKMSVFTCP